MHLTLQRTERAERYTMGKLSITCKDTRGCILVGQLRVPGLIIRSRDTLSELMERIAQRPLGEPITITILD